MNVYSFLIGALVASYSIDLLIWPRRRLLASALNAIVFFFVGIATLVDTAPGSGEIFFGYIALIVGVGWSGYALHLHRKKAGGEPKGSDSIASDKRGR